MATTTAPAEAACSLRGDAGSYRSADWPFDRSTAVCTQCQPRYVAVRLEAPRLGIAYLVWDRQQRAPVQWRRGWEQVASTARRLNRAERAGAVDGHDT